MNTHVPMYSSPNVRINYDSNKEISFCPPGYLPKTLLSFSRDHCYPKLMFFHSQLCSFNFYFMYPRISYASIILHDLDFI